MWEAYYPRCLDNVESYDDEDLSSAGDYGDTGFSEERP